MVTSQLIRVEYTLSLINPPDLGLRSVGRFTVNSFDLVSLPQKTTTSVDFFTIATGLSMPARLGEAHGVKLGAGRVMQAAQ